MKKDLQLSKRLKQYAGLATAMTGAATIGNAQVMYTDVSPDATVSAPGGTSYSLDFDGSVTDFVFTGYLVAIPSASISINLLGISGSTGSNSIEGTATYMAGAGFSINVISALSAGVNVNSTGGMINATAPYWIYNGVGGLWYGSGTYAGPMLGQTDTYAGVAFDIGGSTHYGWIRFDVAANGSTMTIKDYAYNATAGAGILTGDMGGVGIDEFDHQVSIIQYDNKLEIGFGNLEGNKTVELIDMLGNKVQVENFNANNAVFLLDEHATGIYMVHVSNADGSTAKKVYIK